MIEKADSLISVSSLLMSGEDLIENSLKYIEAFPDSEDEIIISRLETNQISIKPEISLAILIFAHYQGKISIREIEWNGCSQCFDVKFYLPQNKFMYQNFTDRIFSIKCGDLVDGYFSIIVNEREDLSSRIKINKSSKILYDIAHDDIHTYKMNERPGIWSSIKYLSGTDTKKSSEFYKLIQGKLRPSDLFVLDERLNAVVPHPDINISTI